MELFNRGREPVNLSGWTVQYAGATGTAWQKTELSGSIQPGGYFLVQQAAGSGGTQGLPAPDSAGNIALAAGAGKVALVAHTQTLSGACPAGPAIVDLVGYGAAANCFEGAAPAPAPTNTTAALRASGGCADSDDNSTDFQTAAPNPRNSQAAPNACAGPGSLAGEAGQSSAGGMEEQRDGVVSGTGRGAGPGGLAALLASLASIVRLGTAPLRLPFGVSGPRPRAGSRRWRRGASASGRPGTRAARPRLRGAWP